jgi:hypothetical protein
MSKPNKKETWSRASKLYLLPVSFCFLANSCLLFNYEYVVDIFLQNVGWLSVGWSVKMMLVLVSTIILGFESRRDPWPRFFSLLYMWMCLEVGLPLQRDEGSDYYWSVPFYWVWLEYTLTHWHSSLHTNTHFGWLSTAYTALYPTRYNISWPPLSEPQILLLFSITSRP